MNYISPSYKSAMDAPIRQIEVGGNQGRGNPPAKTGWPAPALAQDDHRSLFQWFSSKPDARRLIRENADAIEQARTAYHTAPAVVAPIKSSTPRFPDMQITMEDDGPGLFMSRVFWALVAVNVVGWGAVALWKLSEWVRS